MKMQMVVVLTGVADVDVVDGTDIRVSLSGPTFHHIAIPTILGTGPLSPTMRELMVATMQQTLSDAFREVAKAHVDKSSTDLLVMTPGSA